MAVTRSSSLRPKANVLFLLNIATCCFADILPAPDHGQCECAQLTAVKIAEQFYSTNFPTMVWSKDSTGNDCLQLFRRRYSGCVLSAEVREGTFSGMPYAGNIPYHVTQYVIYVDQIKHLEYFINQMKKESMFANYGKFIIICEDEGRTADECNVEALFRICWRHRLVNVIVLHATRDGELAVSTYFPMEEGLCDSTKPKVYYKLRDCANYRSIHHLFPDKFNNFNGCPLTITTYVAPPFIKMETNTRGMRKISGIVGDLYIAVSEVMNATLKLVETDYGSFNGTHWTGWFDNLLMRRADISSLSTLHFDTVRAFRIVYPRCVTNVGWITPPVPLRPAWEKLIKPFNFQLRLLFSLVILVLILVLIVLKESRLRDKWNAYFTTDVIDTNLYINTCAIWFGQRTVKRPTKAALACCLTMWIWFSFFMLNAYQGALVGVLKQEDYEIDLNTVAGAIRAGYDFGGPSELRTYFAEKSKLYELYKVMQYSDIDKNVPLLARGSRKLIIHLHLDYVPFYNLKTNYSHFLNVIPSDVKQRYITHYLQPDSPLADTLSDVYARLAANGILQKVDAQKRHITDMDKRNNLWKKEKEIILTMHHMRACFLVVIGGSIMSTSLLIMELIWKRSELYRCSKYR